MMPDATVIAHRLRSPVAGMMRSAWHMCQSPLAILMRYSVALLGVFLFCVSHYINRSFGQPDLDQIAYHLNYGVDAMSSADPVLVERFMRWCVAGPLALLAIVIVVEQLWRWRRRSRATPQRRVARLRRQLHAWWPGALLFAALVFWAAQLSVPSYIAGAFGPDYFAAHYVAPERVALRAVQPKNLLLIYVESLEKSYSDSALFGKDLLAPLNAQGGSSFAAYRQTPGTGWTIAAMVATQCGVPLKRVTLLDENTQGEVIRSFLPNATCLSDILSEHGYRNVFMAGASSRFAGKDKFLRDHHYDAVYGREDWLRAGVRRADMNGWGLYDVDLMARARQQLAELEATHKPYSLTLLTVDTHEPAGHLSRSCAARGHRGFEGVIACSAEEVAGLVNFMRDSGFLANTNVVILGDHLARKNPLTDKLPAMASRHIFNAFISEDPSAAARPAHKNTEQITHFDMLPTILEFSGFEVAGGRMGLGYGAFDGHAAAPAARFEEMESSLMNHSPSYLALWGVDSAPKRGQGPVVSPPSLALN